MKKDIILAGVGGQGILTIAAVIGHAALAQGLHVKQAEVHGMSQRGGDVQSHLRLSSDPIASDLIPRGCADLIIAMEPMEALRYLPWLTPGGWIVANTASVVNIPNYPDAGALAAELEALPRRVLLNAEELSRRSANMALLGATSALLDLGGLEYAVRKIFASKGDAIVAANLEALEKGAKIAAKSSHKRH